MPQARLLDRSARGFFAIAPTPFAPDGALDLEAVGPMAQAYAAAGAAGITVLGVMGEAPKLTEAESLEVVRAAIRHAGEMPVVVGVSAPGLASMAALARGAMEAGAAGVMIAPTPGLKGDDGVLGYLRHAARAVGPETPWVLQDFPPANGIAISPAIVATLAAETNCVMLKAEDWPGLDKLGLLRRMMEDGRMKRISLVGGNGGLFLPHELARGADGVMTGYAFPEMLVQVQRLVEAGEAEAAHDLFDAHLPLIRYETQPGLGLAVRKYVLRRRGILPHATLRTPAPAFTDATRAEVDLLLARLARRLAALGQPGFSLRD